MAGGGGIDRGVALSLVQTGRAEAVALIFTLNNTTAGATTNADLTITLDADLTPTQTITLTFPAGWTVANGALQGVWVQSADRTFHVLVVGGPQFMRDAFIRAFPPGVAANTPVILVQAARPGGGG